MKKMMEVVKYSIVYYHSKTLCSEAPNPMSLRHGLHKGPYGTACCKQVSSPDPCVFASDYSPRDHRPLMTSHNILFPELGIQSTLIK